MDLPVVTREVASRSEASNILSSPNRCAEVTWLVFIGAPLAGILPPDEAITRIKGFIEKTYAKRGEAVVARNFAAVDRALAGLAHVAPGAIADPQATTQPAPDAVPDFVTRITSRLIAGEGDLLPVSALPVDGTFPTGTPLFSGLLVGTVLLVAGLTFVPVLALGPILEHLSL